MLEILFIVMLCQKMGTKMRAKGYDKPFWFQFFVPVCWVGGEFLGGVIYGVVRLIRQIPDTGFDIFLYLTALAIAGISVGILFLIASNFSNRTAPPPPLPYQ